MALPPGLQESLDEEFEEWLQELLLDHSRIPRAVLKAIDEDDNEKLARELQVSFLAEKLESLVIASGKYRPKLRREPDGTISTLWEKK